MKKWLPLILTAVMAAWFLNTLRPPPVVDFHYAEFGGLPVVFNGRLQPMDSLARNSLLQIREKQTANLEPWKGWNEKPKIIPAIEWLANVMMNPAVADQWPVFRVDNPDLVALLKLPGKDESQRQDGKYYSWNQIQPALDALDRENERIDKIEPASRNAYKHAVVKMRERLMLYARLGNTLQPPDAQNWNHELTEYENLIPAGVAAARAKQANQKYDEAAFSRFAVLIQEFDAMSGLEPPLVVPPHHSELSHDDWRRTGESLLGALRTGTIDPAVLHYAAMAGAFQAGNADEFNRQLAGYRAFLAPEFSRELQKSRHEVFFNQMQPFYAAMVIYVLAGLLASLSWFNLSEMLRRSAAWLIGLAFAIHTTGLVFRIVLEGRPPVTNLYSVGDFRRLGRGRAWTCAGTISQERHRRGGFGGHRLHHPPHRAKSRARRRHDGNDARGAGHEFLAGDARRCRHARLREHVCRGISGD